MTVTNTTDQTRAPQLLFGNCTNFILYKKKNISRDTRDTKVNLHRFGFGWFASARHCAWQVGRVDELGAGLGGGLADRLMLGLSFAEIAGIKKRWILAIREFIDILLIINLIHTNLCMFTATDQLRCRHIKLFYALVVYTFSSRTGFHPISSCVVWLAVRQKITLPPISALPRSFL